MKRTEYSTKDLRERTDDELKGMVRTLREDLFKHRLGRATNQLEDVSKIKRTKRDLARVLTIQQLRALGQEPTRMTKEA
jgi:large subunit ribosomal protein L29